MRIWITATIASSLVISASHAQEVILRIKVRNISTAEGVIRMAIYDNARKFTSTSDSDIYRNGVAMARSPETILQMPVQQGRCYGIVIFHDVNNNGQFDRNFWGYPVEDVGFSQDVQPSLLTLSPPSFEDARVCIRKDTTIIIHLQRF